MGRRSTAVVVSLVAALWSAPGWAHTSDRAFELPTPVATPMTTDLPVAVDARTVAALAAIALVILAARRRRSMGAVLAVLTLWMTFEAGAHSVHHLGQPSEEGRCAVASTTAHGSAIPSALGACDGIPTARTSIVGVLAPATHERGLLATYEGRAPPHLSR